MRREWGMERSCGRVGKERGFEKVGDGEPVEG